jgi:hypothetical protein
MKQIWRKKSLLISELIFPIFVVAILCGLVATLTPDLNRSPLEFAPFGFDAVALKGW